MFLIILLLSFWWGYFLLFCEGHDIKCRSRTYVRWSNADVMTWMLLTIKLSCFSHCHLLSDDVFLILLLNSQISSMFFPCSSHFPPRFLYCFSIKLSNVSHDFSLSSMLSPQFIPIVFPLSSMLILLSSHYHLWSLMLSPDFLPVFSCFSIVFSCCPPGFLLDLIVSPLSSLFSSSCFSCFLPVDPDDDRD